MATNFAWQLPKGFDELLPDQAWLLERYRQKILKLTYLWGYDYIIPPFAEFMDVLSVGTGQDLASEILQVADNHSDRMLGIRADMTPQIARIDAHKYGSAEQVNRFCYLGTVLRAQGELNTIGSRSPYQFGAELYGHSGTEADREIIMLLLTCLKAIDKPAETLDFGHMGVFHHIRHTLSLNQLQTRRLYEILQSKSKSDLIDWTIANDINESYRPILTNLLDCHGSYEEACDQFEALILPHMPELSDNLISLKSLIQEIQTLNPAVDCQLDFAEFKGYRYHTGIVFAAYSQQYQAEIARGGRYDHIGEAFGRARAATGFSADLKSLLRLDQQIHHDEASSIFVPYQQQISAELTAKLSELRDQGYRIIQALHPTEKATDHHCEHTLAYDKTQWTIIHTPSSTNQ